MELIELDDMQISEIYNKYMKTDFPKSELKPLKLLLDCREKGLYKCFGLFDAGELKAYAYLANYKEEDVILLDYLAVIRDIRGKGYGSIMLTELKNHYKNNTKVKAVIIEAESIRSAKDNEQIKLREKRIRFYKRNGLIEQKLLPVVFGTEFTILVLEIQDMVDDMRKASNKYEEYITEGYKNIYRAILSKEMYEKNIIIKL